MRSCRRCHPDIRAPARAEAASRGVGGSRLYPSAYPPGLTLRLSHLPSTALQQDWNDHKQHLPRHLPDLSFCHLWSPAVVSIGKIQPGARGQRSLVPGTEPGRTRSRRFSWANGAACLPRACSSFQPRPSSEDPQEYLNQAPVALQVPGASWASLSASAAWAEHRDWCYILYQGPGWSYRASLNFAFLSRDPGKNPSLTAH